MYIVNVINDTVNDIIKTITTTSDIVNDTNDQISWDLLPFWMTTSCFLLWKQECIPVGCVPAAHRPYAGVCFWGCVVPGGVCSGGWSRGMSAPGGVWSGGGGGGIPACTEADPLLWTEWMTDRCKNITLATTSLRPVKKQLCDKPRGLLVHMIALIMRRMWILSDRLTWVHWKSIGFCWV